MGSSRRCAGVSAFTGRSLKSLRPSLPCKTSSLASATGIKPAGILRWKGILAPTIAAIVASPAPRRKPRRSGYETRPKKALSAAIGSFAKNSCRPMPSCGLSSFVIVSSRFAASNDNNARHAPFIPSTEWSGHRRVRKGRNSSDRLDDSDHLAHADGSSQRILDELCCPRIYTAQTQIDDHLGSVAGLAGGVHARWHVTHFGHRLDQPRKKTRVSCADDVEQSFQRGGVGGLRLRLSRRGRIRCHGEKSFTCDQLKNARSNTRRPLGSRGSNSPNDRYAK